MTSIMNIIIKDPNGFRWKVKTAVSLQAACKAIEFAKVAGSVGTTDTETNVTDDGCTTKILASVARVHPDGTEVQPS